MPRLFRLVSLMVVLLVPFTLVAVDGPRLATPSDPPLPTVGADIPALSLRAYNEEVANKLVGGTSVSANNFVGLSPEQPRQVLIIHFFSVENSRSVEDLATLQKLFKKYQDEGVMVISISVDPSSQEKVYTTIEESRVTYPVLRDRFGVVARRYGIRKIPSLIITDADGRIASAGEGYSSDIENFVDSEIRALLKDQAAAAP